MKKRMISIVVAGCLIFQGGMFSVPALAEESPSAAAEKTTGEETNTPGDAEEPVTDVVMNSSTGKWTYTVDGVPDYSYTGFAKNSYGWWYIEDGTVTFKKDSIIQDMTGALGSTSDWYYVVESKVQTDYTGVSNFANAYGWWYIKNGKVDFSVNSVEENQYGWWNVESGKVVFSDTVAQNRYGWWYCTGGKVDFGFSGLGNHGNAYGWWYINKGKVDFSVNTVAQNNYGWWYVEGGKVQFGYTGVSNYENPYGWWYIKNGKVDFSANTVAQNKYGWWYVLSGKVQFGFTGLGNYCNEYGWWYINKGKVDFSVNTVAQNNYGWWYVEGGKVQFGYTGVSNYENPYGWWYIKNGKVDFSANTVAQNKYGWWYVLSGKVQFGFTGLGNYCNDYGWWYIKNGKVTFDFTGIASNQYGTWYVVDSKVDFSYTGTVNYNGTAYNVINGKVGLTTPTLKATTVDYDGIKVSWNAVDGASGYQVFRKTETGSWSAIGTTTSTSYVDKNSGSNGTIYYYTVRAYAGDLNTALQHTYDVGYWSGYDGTGVSGCSYNIMGTSSVTADQLIQSLKNAGYESKVRKTLTDCSLEDFAKYYIEESKAEGVRAEVAWCQSILETNWFTFEGCAVDPSYHNYCGHGATDSGGTPEYYSSSRIGVRAQMQHLKAYASTDALNQTCVDARFNLVKRGSAKFVEILGQKENPGGYGWATGADYGPHIVRLIRQTNLAGK